MQNEIESVAEIILRYFERRPETADTIEGIAQWIVAPDDPGRSMMEIGAALELLVARGRLDMITVGGRVLYRLRRPTTS